MAQGAKWKNGMDGSVLSVVEMTADVALKVARVDTSLPRPDQEAQVQARIDEGLLGADAIRALKDAGYRVSTHATPRPT